MPLYEIKSDSIQPVSPTSFAREKVNERENLQRLLRDQIEIISPDTMVIAEEFGEWEDSKRRIDLLGLDKDGNLVVIELKRSEDGGHMELQAIRYAAMVSTMTFDQVVRVHSRFLAAQGKDDNAEETILSFLEWEEPDEDKFAQDVRIVLVSAEFSKEITTAVLWLNTRQLDVRCVRIKPYNHDGKLLADIQQVIPLPETQEFQVKVREKEQRIRSKRKSKKDISVILSEIDQNCSKEVAFIARSIYDWLLPQISTMDTTSNSYAPVIEAGGLKHFLFKVTTDGEVEIRFELLSWDKPPFCDEELRLDLLRRFNRVPGLDIGEDKVSGKPKFSLELLKDDKALAIFKETVLWAYETIRDYFDGDREIQ
jgi:hypothetical protein